MSSISLVSVIIPIYNVSTYLRECLDSVVNQTYRNLEIILVNDGSTDESEEIAKEYLKDRRVQLISIPNGGLSKARNVGMDNANGEFVYFIDSDDYIDLGFLEEMVKIAQENGVDIVCNEQIVRFEGKDKKLRQEREVRVLIPDSQNIAIGGAVWRCLFTRSLIITSGVYFLEGKIHEDEGFLYMIFPLCQKFAIYCGRPYYYRQRVGSIMDQHKKFRSYDLLDIFEEIFLFYREKGLLGIFKPPYFLLYDCGVGYQNEKEYAKRAREIECRLGLQYAPRPLMSKVYIGIKNVIKKCLLWRHDV